MNIYGEFHVTNKIKNKHMKKALFFLIAVTLFTACKNEKRPSTNRVKDDYRSNDKNTDNSNNDRNTDSRDKEDNTASWPRSDENKFMDECESSAKENVGAVRANEYCDCMLQKMKKMFIVSLRSISYQICQINLYN